MTTDRDTVIPCAQPAWHTHSYPYFTPPEHLALCLATSADPASGYRTPVAVSVITQVTGSLIQCMWCWRTAVVAIKDGGWTDYACYAHGAEWYPAEMRQVRRAL